jgi:demethylmenaquinone methyltransferase / 2-methoxy-6-polyprenyl-1,4-benzoquinol methylase
MSEWLPKAGGGTTPPGAETEEQAAQWVRRMFGEVAPRYDSLNHILSMNIDKGWRRATVARLAEVLRRPDAVVIDLCCGTCDLLAALEQAGPSRSFGTDFCHPMLTAAQRKRLRSPLFEADAMRLPLRDRSADILTVAFGFRNLANYHKGLVEMRRVLKPGGVAAILEFSTPPSPWFASLYRFYSNQILPRIGAALSGAREAYTYLPASVSKFPDADGLTALMRDAGFVDVKFERMSMGIVALHVGSRL